MSNLSDVVGGANLFGGSSYSYVPDRFCTANSAIYFNHGYLQVPSGIYFSGDFTVTAWIYLKSYRSWSRIFDFGNGGPSDNVVLSTVEKMYALTFHGSNNIPYLTSSHVINLNQWYFVAYDLSGTTGYIYVDGIQVATGTLLVPNNIQRTSNYIGKNNWPTRPIADAIYDEIKIFQGALTSTDIMNEYQTSSNDGIF